LQLKAKSLRNLFGGASERSFQNRPAAQLRRDDDETFPPLLKDFGARLQLSGDRSMWVQRALSDNSLSSGCPISTRHRPVAPASAVKIGGQANSPFFELARTLVRFDHVATLIVNANHSIL
jgi:hypothetical protein